MEKVNIAELLKDCPSGMELNCTMFNGVYFDHVDDLRLNSIKCYVNNGNEHFEITLDEHGQYISNKSAKCVIFPKGKTTWEGFVPPYKFNDGDVVYVQSKTFHGRYYEYICIYKENSVNNDNLHKYIAICGDDFLYNTTALCYKSVITNIRLATEEEKQKLFQAIKDNGYKWIPETKTLERIKPKFKVGDRIKSKISQNVYTITDIREDNYVAYTVAEKFCYHISFYAEKNYELITNKFDINTLVPFESKVLIRNDKTQKWIPAFWGYKADNGNYVTTFGTCRYCIPYEGNEHLLRTSNDCDDYYKIWEE